MRRANVTGILGMLMLLAGAFLYLRGSETRVNWLYWLGGPFLWYVGFSFTMAWGLTRVLRVNQSGTLKNSRHPSSST